MTPERPQLPFAHQRLVFFGLLFGMVMYAVTVAVILQVGGTGLATERIDVLDTIVVAVGGAALAGALTLRSLLRRNVESATGAARSHARFHATLVPIALLEGGVLLALTAWLLNGNPVPNVVVAMVLLAAAIAIVPFADPDAGT
jgi:hypothetical protein